MAIRQPFPAEFRLESKPSPTHLQLTDFPLTSVSIDWDNITYMSIEEALEFLRQARNVECYRFLLKILLALQSGSRRHAYPSSPPPFTEFTRDNLYK